MVTVRRYGILFLHVIFSQKGPSHLLVSNIPTYVHISKLLIPVNLSTSENRTLCTFACNMHGQRYTNLSLGSLPIAAMSGVVTGHM